VQVSWVSPADGAAVSAAPTVSVHVGHPDGISSVSILSGTTVVGTKAGNVATTAPAQVDVQVDMSAIPEGNATLTATATSTKGATGSAPQRTFLVDKHENTPTLVSFTPASPNNAALTTFTVKGAADLGPSATTVYLFTDSTCGGGNVANAVFSGSATSLIEPGFQVPVIPNSDTTYYAMSVDSAGNASPCSSTLTTNGSINFVNVVRRRLPSRDG
jgi:hypothetical protein